MSTRTDLRRAILAAPVGWLLAGGVAPARSAAAMKRRGVLRLGAWASALLAPPLAWATTAGAEAAWFDAASRGDVPQLQRLVAAGIPIDRRDVAGRTALLRATAANRLEPARWLIERGADVNAKDAIDDSPYLLAGARGHTEILRLALAAGARHDIADAQGVTPLAHARQRGQSANVALLQPAGARQ